MNRRPDCVNTGKEGRGAGAFLLRAGAGAVWGALRGVGALGALAAAGAVVAGLSGCLAQPEDRDPRREAPASPAGWPAIAWPEDNPYQPEKAELGRLLFFEPRLSRDQVISCSWCHSERASFADNHHTPFSTGFELIPTRRNTPTLVNAAFGASFMWAGEVETLEEQAIIPLLSPDEMNMTAEDIEAMLTGDSAYVARFHEVFGPGPITLAHVARALATYQRTLISTRAPYDAWQAGDSTALTAAQRRGHALFTGKANCAACHTPPLFTDGKFHNTGLDVAGADSGRAAVTGRPADAGKFKTPTLRNVAVTHPYMHDGRFEDLGAVVEHYNSGGHPHPARDARVHPLNLAPEEKEDLVAFLHSLTDQDFLTHHNP